MEDKHCPFLKEIVNTGWGGPDGSYPTTQHEIFLLCIGKGCMAWDAHEYICKLIDKK